jgi:Lon protease-like protein
MIDLPLFPLNTVLFPGIPFQLHIFEERYKQMISECLDSAEPFGVVLIKSGLEALGPLAETYSVGCTAEILQVEKLPGGRMNIAIVGQERFRIHNLNYDQPFLVGQVEIAPFRADPSGEMRQAGDRLRILVNRYLAALEKTGKVEIEIGGLPEDPLRLAYLAAYIVQAPSQQKQTLLAEEHARAFLEGLLTLYPRELALLKMIVATESSENPPQFFLN